MTVKGRRTSSLKRTFGRFFIYGDSGVYKTRFASTFPRPLFLACATEGGIMSLRDRKGVDYIEVQDPEDTTERLEDLAVDADEGKLRYRTIVIDSLTILQENQLDILTGRRREAVDAKKRAKGSREKTGFYDNVNLTEAEWNQITTSLRSMFILAHSIPAHIIWVALARREFTRMARGEDEILLKGFPMIYTKPQALKMPAVCDYTWYMDMIESRGKSLYRIHTSTYQKMIARTRDDIPAVIKSKSPTFKMVNKYLGLKTGKEKE